MKKSDYSALSRAERVRLAANWAAAQYEERTRAIAEGGGRLTWAHAPSRVTWCEVREQFALHVATDRVPWTVEYRKALRRRSLLGVLAGRRSAHDWYEARLNVWRATAEPD